MTDSLVRHYADGAHERKGPQRPSDEDEAERTGKELDGVKSSEMGEQRTPAPDEVVDDE